MKANKQILTQLRLKELLDYDPETGLFAWLKTGTGRKHKPGQWFSGCKQQSRSAIKIDGRLYGAHRLAWLYMHGRFPPEELDHKDGDIRNNRILNLREATKSQNQQNRRKAQASSDSGFMGVCFDRRCKDRPWFARINIDIGRVNLGYFAAPEDAHAAYLDAKARHHPFQTLVPTIPTTELPK